MADVILTKRVPEAKVPKALEGWLALFPNSETKDDPEWVDPEDGSIAPQVPKYTDKQWVEEKDLRIFIRNIHRGLQKLADKEATVEVDDDIATID